MSGVSFTALTPLAFLGRSSEVFADKTAVVYGDRRWTYREFATEATRVARALQASGVRAGDRVAYLCPNTPEMLVATFAVPLAGAILVPVNTRLSAEEVRYICDHSGATLLVADTEFLPPLAAHLGKLRTVREVVTVYDPAGPAEPETGTTISYEDFAARGSEEPLPWSVEDELGVCFGRRVGRVERHFGVERRFVRIVHAGEPGDDRPYRCHGHVGPGNGDP